MMDPWWDSWLRVYRGSPPREHHRRQDTPSTVDPPQPLPLKETQYILHHGTKAYRAWKFEKEALEK